LLVKDVAIYLSWECLLKVLLLHLVFVVVAIPDPKVLIIVRVVEQVAVTVVKLEGVASVATHVVMVIWLVPTTSIIVRHLYILNIIIFKTLYFIV
jgi:hypothetical protein